MKFFLLIGMWIYFFCTAVFAFTLHKQSAFVSASSFGARGDGRADDTRALQSALDSGEDVLLAKGTYRITSTLYIRVDNSRLIGNGPKSTVISYEGMGAVIENQQSSNKTRYWCKLKDMRIEVNNPNHRGPAINWNSMQFGTLEDLWIIGNRAPGSIGINLAAVYTSTEATYNMIKHIYVGLVEIGLNMGNGANSNTIESSRFQPIENGVAIYMQGPMNNNRILHSGFEYPGKVSGGILLNGYVRSTLIMGNRFEGLIYGWKSNGASNADTVALANYFSSMGDNWVDTGSRSQNFDRPSQVKPS